MKESVLIMKEKNTATLVLPTLYLPAGNTHSC